MTELEERDRKRGEEEAKSKGQWDVLLGSKDERIGKLATENAELAKQLADTKAAIAERDILDGLADHFKGADRKMVGAAYRDIVASRGLDRVPKDTAAAIKERAELLAKEYPSLTSSSSGSGGSGGGGSPTPSNGGNAKKKFNLL